MINNKITKQKLEKYYNLTSKALKIAKKAVVKSKAKHAKEIFTMVEAYLSDSQHFQKKGEYVLAYGALNYAHGWLDAGARIKIYRVNDNNLFTV
tara:strand:+ start:52 stop:333 length:282 start_codon:yes stop_codon:yes gene_type:complete